LLLSCEDALQGEQSAPPFDSSVTFAAPVLEAGDGAIAVSWDVVPGAEVYGVYYGKASNGSGRVQYGPDIPDTTVAIKGLVNLHTYHVWVQAKDADGYSVESDAASLFLLERPSTAPTVRLSGKEGGQADLSWEPARQATAYEVWYGTEADPKTASKWPLDISGSVATIVGFSNNQTYYLWVRSKTVCGVSAFSPPASIMPQALLGGTVTIRGNPMVGERLTVNTTGLDRDGARSYRWHSTDMAGGKKTPIPGAEAVNYTPDNDTWNKYISVEVTAQGYRGTIWSPETAAVGFPRIGWTPAKVTPPLGNAWFGGFIYCKIGSEWLWIGAASSGMLLSRDGVNWEFTATAFTGGGVVDTGLDSDMRFVAANGRLHSPDGKTWKSLTHRYPSAWPSSTSLRCLAYGVINGTGLYIAAYGQLGLAYSTDCQNWAPALHDDGGGVFGAVSPDSYLQVESIVFDEQNHRFMAQAEADSGAIKRWAYSENGFAWNGPNNGAMPVPPVRGDAARFYYYTNDYPEIYELRFIDETNRELSLPRGLVGGFGCISIDGRPAVIVTGTGYRWYDTWRFYSMDQGQQ
jgi:hypothetical protein